MRSYRIPVRQHGPNARSKGVVPRGAARRPGHYSLCDWIRLEAATHREAAEKLRRLFLPRDPRPVRGTADVALFVTVAPADDPLELRVDTFDVRLYREPGNRSGGSIT